MIQFDKTQEINTNPRHDFGGGLILRRVSGTTYEAIDFGGEHQRYVVAQEIEYAPSLQEQFLISRSIRSDA